MGEEESPLCLLKSAPVPAGARCAGRGWHGMDGRSSRMEQTGSSTRWLKRKEKKNHNQTKQTKEAVGYRLCHNHGVGNHLGGTQTPAPTGRAGEKLHEKCGCTEGPRALRTPRGRAGSSQPDTGFTRNEANHSAL